ncbi:MAG: tetratricopeptide repeat protein [Spirochaetaceae bacterium]|nr:tetratricopeptide repeat protein [Spirochaetaceae bacterium]
MPNFQAQEDLFELPESLDDEINEISEASKKGYQLLKENRYDEAIECFAQILEKDNENNYALVGLGDAARKRGAYKEAADHYRRCLVFHPGNSYALFGLADCYKALNQYHKAIEIWEQYLLHDNSNITVLTRVADAYRKVHDFRKSKAIYQRVLEMEADNHYALIGLGHLHYDFKEYKEALGYWQRMVDLQGSQVDIRVLTSIGNCYRKLKQFDKGIPYFEKALEREADNFYALFGIADCYRGVGKQSVSLKYWNKILEKDPQNKVILTRAGDAYRNMGELDKATKCYEDALNIEYDVYAILGLAVIARAQGKFDDAITSLRMLIQNDPKNYRIYMELAQCHLAAGQKQQAIDVLNDFQKLGIKNPYIQDAIAKLTAKAQ